MLDALQPVVMRYLVWSCSTADVEQRFSIGDRVGVDRTPASQITEGFTLRAVFDKVSADERPEVVRRAQELSAEGCPQDKEPSPALQAGQGGKEVVDNKGKH